VIFIITKKGIQWEILGHMKLYSFNFSNYRVKILMKF